MPFKGHTWVKCPKCGGSGIGDPRTLIVGASKGKETRHIAYSSDVLLSVAGLQRISDDLSTQGYLIFDTELIDDRCLLCNGRKVITDKKAVKYGLGFKVS